MKAIHDYDLLSARYDHPALHDPGPPRRASASPVESPRATLQRALRALRDLSPRATGRYVCPVCGSRTSSWICTGLRTHPVVVTEERP